MRSILVLSLLCGATPVVAQVEVPRGKPVLVDGRIDPVEWRDAAQLPLADVARVYLKQSGGFVFVGIQLLKDDNGIVDLYLSPAGGELHDLHASAKLGERALQGGAWPEWRWWNNEGWVANVARFDAWEGRSLLKESAREFQISRQRFPGRAWRLLFELGIEARGAWRAARFPPHASETDAAGWYLVRLGP